MLPKALSKALGVSLSEVLDCYYIESDEVERGHLIENTLDREQMGDRDQEWLDGESQCREEAKISSHRREDDTY
jgi:hypothetical protein